jgi:hypothetical protein
MYSLTIQHGSQTIDLKWKLKAIDDDDENVVFSNVKFMAPNEYSRVDNNTAICITYKNKEIVHLYFHPERLMYFLQFIQSGSAVREYYLEEDELEACKKYSVVFTV